MKCSCFLRQKTLARASARVHSPNNWILLHTRTTAEEKGNTTHFTSLQQLPKSQIQKYCLHSILLCNEPSQILAAINNSYLFLAQDCMGQQFGLGSTGQVSAVSKAVLSVGWLLAGANVETRSLITQKASLGLFTPRSKRVPSTASGQAPTQKRFSSLCLCCVSKCLIGPIKFHAILVQGVEKRTSLLEGKIYNFTMQGCTCAGERKELVAIFTVNHRY